jgi:DNA helicase IV
VRLPTYQELSKEQDRINNLPINDSHLVVGPPGTGKTVMALYRANMLTQSQVDTCLLMYSRLLSQYTGTAFDALGIGGSVSTFHSWFTSFCHRQYGCAPPEIERYKYDWTEVLATIGANPPSAAQIPHLIIDEAQDLSRQFFLVARYLSKTVMVFADENQRINEDNSTIEDIKSHSGITKVHLLTRNYRNTAEVARLAAHFYTGLPSGIPELPTRSGPKPVLLRHNSLRDAVEFIARYERNNPDLEVGVFTPTKALQRKFVNRLEGKTKNPVQHYVGGWGRNAEPLNFQVPGIKVINFASAKGLEFDTVFIPELQELTMDMHRPEMRMRFYVLTSRTRNELFLSYSGQDRPLVVDSLPSELLEWRET